VLSSTAPGAGTGGAQHRQHGGFAEALRGGHRFWPARALHAGFLDLVFGQQRQAQFGGERRSQRALAGSRLAGHEHQPAAG